MAVSQENQRLSALLAAFSASIACGSLYGYSTFSTQLAERLHLTATDSSLIVMSGTFGIAFLAYITGLIIDCWGITIACSLGAVGLFVGYGAIYTAYQYIISSMPLLCLALGIVGFSSALAYNSCLKTCAWNFPHCRGVAVSVPMAANGLSALMLSTASGTMYAGDTPGLLMFLVIAPTLLVIISIPFIKIYEQDEQERPKSEIEELEQRPLLQKDSVCTNQDVGGIKIVLDQRYWHHAFLLALISFPGTMYIYGVGFLVRALKPDASPEDIQAMQSVQVAAIALSNAGSRIASGLLSDYIKDNNSQRLWVMFIALVVLIGGNISATLASEMDLWKVSCLFGIGYGLSHGAYPPIVFEQFGMESVNWCLVAMSQVFSSYGASYIFGRIYDSNSEWIHKKWVCSKGIDCYKDSFLISLNLNLLTMALLFYVIHFNYKHYNYHKQRRNK